MAITWEPIITPVDVDAGIISITAKATDDTDPDNPITVSIQNAVLGTPAENLATLNTLYAKYEKKVAAMPYNEGPDYILEPNPDGPAVSAKELKTLEANDSSTLHQKERVWWVKQKQDNVEFAGMVEATDTHRSRGALCAELRGRCLA